MLYALIGTIVVLGVVLIVVLGFLRNPDTQELRIEVRNIKIKILKKSKKTGYHLKKDKKI